MKTTDLFITSSKKLNESLAKTFGKRINFEQFELEQLHDARNKLRTQVSQIRGQSGFNENLENDAFHQAQWMLDAINAEIAERDEHIIEAEADDDLSNKTKELNMWLAKYDDYTGGNGDALPIGWIKSMTDTGIISDGYEQDEITAFEKKIGKEESEWEDAEWDEFSKPENSPITSKMFADLANIIGTDDRDEDVARAVSSAIGIGESVQEGKMSEIDIDLQTLANRGDEDELISALQGEMGSGVADVLNDMMSELQDELASKGMNDVMRDDDKMIEILWDKLVDEYGGDDDFDDEGGETDDDYALKSAGFGSDEDYGDFGRDENIQYEDRVDEKAVSKAQQRAAGIALAAKRKGKTPPGKGAAAEMAKMTTKELEKYAGTKHKNLPAKKDESVEQGEDMTTLREGEVQQASAIVTAKTMVDRVGRWIEELSGMENETLLQLGDSIRDEMGQEQAKAFIEQTAPAIQSALETLKGTRDTLSTSVRSLASGEQPADMLGAEPALGGDEEMGPAEPDMMNTGEEPAGDEFAAAEPAAGGMEAPGREQRESIERQNRLLKVLAG